MYISIPKELLEQAIEELNKAKLMMCGGMYTMQGLPIPTSVKRHLVESSFKVNILAGNLFAYTLKNEFINDEIADVRVVNDRALKDALRHFDKKHKDT